MYALDNRSVAHVSFGNYLTFMSIELAENACRDTKIGQWV